MTQIHRDRDDGARGPSSCRRRCFRTASSCPPRAGRTRPRGCASCSTPSHTCSAPASTTRWARSSRCTTASRPCTSRGYSFAIGHLGTTDMDLYTSVEIADGARRTVSALRKFQLTMAVGDPEKGIPPQAPRDPAGRRRHGRRLRQHLQRPAHDRALRERRRRGRAHRGPGAAEALRPHRRQGAHPGERDDRQAAHGARRRRRPRPPGLRRHRAHRRRLRGRRAGEGARHRPRRSSARSATSTPGIPDLLWCEFPTSEREPVERSPSQVRRALPGSALRVQLVELVQVVQRSRPDHLRASSASSGSASSSSPSARSTRWAHGLSKLLQRHEREAGAGRTSSSSARNGRRARTSRPGAITSSPACRTTSSSARPTTPRASARSSSRSSRTRRSCRARGGISRGLTGHRFRSSPLPLDPLPLDPPRSTRTAPRGHGRTAVRVSARQLRELVARNRERGGEPCPILRRVEPAARPGRVGEGDGDRVARAGGGRPRGR